MTEHVKLPQPGRESRIRHADRTPKTSVICADCLVGPTWQFCQEGRRGDSICRLLELLPTLTGDHDAAAVALS